MTLSQILIQFWLESLHSVSFTSSQDWTIRRFRSETGAKICSAQIVALSIIDKHLLTSNASRPPGSRKFSWVTTISLLQTRRAPISDWNFKNKGLCKTITSADILSGAHSNSSPSRSSSSTRTGLAGLSPNIADRIPNTVTSAMRTSSASWRTTAVAVPPRNLGSMTIAIRMVSPHFGISVSRQSTAPPSVQ